MNLNKFVIPILIFTVQDSCEEKPTIIVTGMCSSFISKNIHLNLPLRRMLLSLLRELNHKNIQSSQSQIDY